MWQQSDANARAPATTESSLMPSSPLPGALPSAEPKASSPAVSSSHVGGAGSVAAPTQGRPARWEKAPTMRLRQQSSPPIVSPSGTVYAPLPEGVDQSIPDIACAWAWFLDVDKDKSGALDLDEMGIFVRKLGLRWKKHDVRKAFDEMADGKHSPKKPVITFENFALWWSRYQTSRRREVSARLNRLFQQVDTKKRKVLRKEEFVRLINTANEDPSIHLLLQWPDSCGTDPRSSPRAGSETSTDSAQRTRRPSVYDSKDNEQLQLDPEIAWSECRKVPLRDDDRDQTGIRSHSFGNKTVHGLGVNFVSFEAYWKDKMNIAEPDIPVLPEFMVLRVEDRVAKERAQYRKAIGAADAFAQHHPSSKKAHVTHWTVLSAKLRALTQLQSSWGQLHNIYEARAESKFAESPLHPRTLDPDSSFTSIWDLISIVLLLYVTVVVPLRVCFGIDVELWSFTFFIEVLVDSFFVADLALNFRIAYYDENGVRESRPTYIARNYLCGWFAVDLTSCLPFGYIQYMTDSDTHSGQQFKGIKAIRLLKMSKMMRLARLKRIVLRHSEDGAGLSSFQLVQSVGFTVFMILFLVHMLSCFYYMVGETNQTLGNGVHVIGWVNSQTEWTPSGASTSIRLNSTLQLDPAISLSTRYVASLYYVLNALENGETAQERWFGIFAEFVRDVILGLVASLITTISISSGTNDADLEQRLHQLRKWMSDQQLPASFRRVTMQYFRRHWTKNSIDLQQLLKECPPALGANMASLLYGRYIATVPVFRGLAPEIIAALCLRCKPINCTRGQAIIQEGEPGKEMYMIISGECEVTEMQGGVRRRLGFLAEGAFFGETPVLGLANEPGLELRVRTVRAATDVQLIYLSRADVHALAEQYAELKARLGRFASCGRGLSSKWLERLDLTKEDLQELSMHFKENVRATTAVRHQSNLEEDAYVSREFLFQQKGVTATAVAKLKALAAKRRAQVQERENREARAKELEEEVERRGGMSATLLRFEDAATTLETLHDAMKSQKQSEMRTRGEMQEQLLSMQRIMETQSAHIEAMRAQMAELAGNGVAGTGREYRMP